MKKIISFLLICLGLITSCAPSGGAASSTATLTNQEQANYVRELLRTNANCRLPCWWGITPGKTSIRDTEHFLQSLGLTVKQRKIESGLTYYAVLFQDKLSEINFGFLELEKDKTIVNVIFVRGNYGSTQSQRDFEAMWESYSPKRTITVYGVPSRVLLTAPGATGTGNTGNNGYILWLFYDDQGILIRYDGVVADLPVYHFCPELQPGADDIHRIDFYLQHPDDALPLESHDGILSTDPSRVKSIQDAAGISLEEFYELFSQNEPACFDTPHDIWRK